MTGSPPALAHRSRLPPDGRGLWSGVLVWGPLLGLPGWKFVGLAILVGGGILVYAILGQLLGAFRIGNSAGAAPHLALPDAKPVSPAPKMLLTLPQPVQRPLPTAGADDERQQEPATKPARSATTFPKSPWITPKTIWIARSAPIRPKARSWFSPRIPASTHIRKVNAPIRPVDAGVAADQRKGAVEQQDVGQRTEDRRDPEDRDEGERRKDLCHHLADGEDEHDDEGRVHEPAMDQRVGQEPQQLLRREAAIGQHPIRDLIEHRVILHRRQPPADAALPAQKPAVASWNIPSSPAITTASATTTGGSALNGRRCDLPWGRAFG
jgi:hypothetical protein